MHLLLMVVKLLFNQLEFQLILVLLLLHALLSKAFIMLGKISISTTPSTAVVFTTNNNGNSKVYMIVLNDEASKGVWKGFVANQERLFLTSPFGQSTSLLLNSSFPSSFRLRTNSPAADLSVFPEFNSLSQNGVPIKGVPNGMFTLYHLEIPENNKNNIQVSYTQTQQAGPARKVPIGPANVAQAPNEDGLFGNTTEWDAAAIYHVTVTTTFGVPIGGRNSLRIRYLGDCARVYLSGSIVQDSFYNGDQTFGFILGVNRHAPKIFTQGFDLRLLPIRSGAPIYLAGWPSFPPGQISVVQLLGIDVLQTQDVTLYAI